MTVLVYAMAYGVGVTGVYLVIRLFSMGFILNFILILLILLQVHVQTDYNYMLSILFVLPLILSNIIFYALADITVDEKIDEKYHLKLSLEYGSVHLKNLKRGVAVTGAAGSGKTESVLLNLIKHFSKHNFCGIIHDYKNFELTELVYPYFRNSNIPFFIISFDPIYHQVNPIAPKYLPDEESVNEISRVLLENLLEQKEFLPSGSTKFFNDAVEGILGGLIWKLKISYPDFCSIPHLIAIYQLMDSQQLIRFLSSDLTSRAMADAFISGVDSERQTAAVKGTLANALKKISTRKIFYCLSGDDIPLNLNCPDNPATVCIVNDPKRDYAYSPVIATIVHSMVKQMSVRNQLSSFILLEEAPTIRLLNMHRIPATLRSYDICTIYVMQDKIQNDLLYGEKASKAILSNLSYQFFGKANDPTTAAYYEKFFEIIQREVVSVSKSENLSFDTRVTRSKKEVSKLRADLFFRLEPGQFVAYADGKEKIVKFKKEKLFRELPAVLNPVKPEEIERNFHKIYLEARELILSLEPQS